MEANWPGSVTAARIEHSVGTLPEGLSAEGFTDAALEKESHTLALYLDVQRVQRRALDVEVDVVDRVAQHVPLLVGALDPAGERGDDVGMGYGLGAAPESALGVEPDVGFTGETAERDVRVAEVIARGGLHPFSLAPGRDQRRRDRMGGGLDSEHGLAQADGDEASGAQGRPLRVREPSLGANGDEDLLWAVAG